ncbi:unnamed protein product [Lota lota]
MVPLGSDNIQLTDGRDPTSGWTNWRGPSLNQSCSPSRRRWNKPVDPRHRILPSPYPDCGITESLHAHSPDSSQVWNELPR